MEKETLFISYCWKDGNVYADELETQLENEFKIIRDKSQLIANDDIYDFMTKIAQCDNVIVVLTEEYVKSLNCMLEMSFLFSQVDWSMKAMILVIDDSLYSIDRKIEVVCYWNTLKRMYSTKNDEIGKTIWEEEYRYIEQVCEQVENFMRGLARRKNPSQIAIVNEIIKKSGRNKDNKKELISKNEKVLMDYILKNENITLKELAEKSNRSDASVRRLVAELVEKGKVQRTGSGLKQYIKAVN